MARAAGAFTAVHAPVEAAAAPVSPHLSDSAAMVVVFDSSSTGDTASQATKRTSAGLDLSTHGQAKALGHKQQLGRLQIVQRLLQQGDAWRPTATEFEDGCQVVGLLGRGAATDVYKVKYKGKLTALKVVRPLRSSMAAAQLPEVLLFREARALKYCQHSNVVRCYGLVRVPAGAKALADPNAHWALLEELLPSGSLAHMVLRQLATPSIPAYSRRDALLWALDVAQALAHLHSLKPLVVHRDLKLENVLLATKAGDASARRVAKLTDFGRHTLLETSQECADVSTVPDQQKQQQPPSPVMSPSGPRVSSSAADRLFEQMTCEGSMSGQDWVLDAPFPPGEVSAAAMPLFAAAPSSFLYKAPEVYRGEPHTEKADVFSLGVILYQLLSRTLLLFSDLKAAEAADDKQYAAKVANGHRAPRPASFPSAALWEVVVRCWAQEPAGRPTAAWVVAQLQAALEAEQEEVAAGKGEKPAKAGPTSIRGAYVGAGPVAGGPVGGALKASSKGPEASGGGCCVIC